MRARRSENSARHETVTPLKRFQSCLTLKQVLYRCCTLYRVRRMPTAIDFEQEIYERWEGAGSSGAAFVDIEAGELHRSLGGYPGPLP
jgi:hypothetical protein